MAFIIDDLDDTFEWKIKIPIPNKNKRETHVFNGVFRRITQDRFDELQKQYDKLYKENQRMRKELKK